MAWAGGAGTRHKFCGQLGHTTDDETGLIYMRARYMDPVTGRFVSEDPARDGVNWYAYARSAPANAFDYTGRSTIEAVFGGLWFAAGAVLVYGAVGGIGGVQALMADLYAALTALRTVWQNFGFSVALQMAVLKMDGGSVTGVPKAILDALVGTIQVSIEMGLVSAIIPGATRMAASVVGTTMMRWGALLMAYE